jgi:hypothetical protein
MLDEEASIHAPTGAPELAGDKDQFQLEDARHAPLDLYLFTAKLVITAW